MGINAEHLSEGDLSWWHLLRSASIYLPKGRGQTTKRMEREALIFITVGSQKFQFNRLLKAVDELVASGTVRDAIFAQTGYSDYEPQHYEYKQFLNHDKFAEMEGKADIIITHGGTGAIIGAVKKGKKVVAVPRLAKYGEHVDDHQLQLIEQFTRSNLISSCENLDELGNVLETVKTKEFDSYQSNTEKYLKSIDNYICRFK